MASNHLVNIYSIFKSKDAWVLPQSGIALCIAVPALFIAIALLLVTPPWTMWEFLSYAILPFVVTFITWIIARIRYYKSGNGVKIALSFSSFKSSIEDLQHARDLIHQYFSENDLSRTLTLKLCNINPNSHKNAEKFVSKYHFDHLFVIQISPATSNENTVRYDVSYIYDSKEFNADWQKATLSHAHRIAREPEGKNRSIPEIARYRATTLFYTILIATAATEFLRQNYTVAQNLSQVLDKNLSTRMNSDEIPRPQIRWLGKTSLIASSAKTLDYLLSDPKHIEKAISDAGAAIEIYGVEFPECYAHQARNLFLFGDAEKALALIKTPDVSSHGPGTQSLFILGNAVLHLLNSDWSTAADRYCELFQLDAMMHYNWDDLVEFADLCSERKYLAAPYIQVMYRFIRGDKDIDPSLVKQAHDWVSSDKSRHVLKKPLDWSKRLGKHPEKKLMLSKGNPKLKKRKKSR